MMVLLSGILIAIVFVGFIYPIFAGKTGDLTREQSTLSMLHDQLSELDRELARGVIGKDEARAARLEIQRRIIAVGTSDGAAAIEGKGGRTALVISALLVPVAGVALYFNLGSPMIPSLPYADRAEEVASKQEIDTLTAQLRAKLLEDENGGPADGWILLGETFMRMERFADAAEAFGQLTQRPDATSGTFSRYAEALVMDEGGAVTPRAERAVDQALALEPSNPAATYYKALAVQQAGALQEAHAMLVARLDLADGFYPWMESYIGLANFIAPNIDAAPLSLADYAPALNGPSVEDVENAAGLSETDRSAFVASMVDRLATRLADQPDDLDGWLQLARAYTVLERGDDARNAYEQASGLLADLPASDPRRTIVAEGIAATQ
tara:strand:- start:828 stop:1973 length:1146 start_codon:yes stop_codon:yes gene_type:complete